MFFPGTLLCVLGFVSALTVSVLDKVGMKQLGLDGVIQQESKKVVCAAQTAFPSRSWQPGVREECFCSAGTPAVARAGPAQERALTPLG